MSGNPLNIELLPPESAANPGPAKEGIVLDREGNPVGGGAFTEPGAVRVRVHTLGGAWFWPLVLLGVPLMLTLGLVLFAIAAAAVIFFLALRLLFGGGPARRSSAGGNRVRRA